MRTIITKQQLEQNLKTNGLKLLMIVFSENPPCNCKKQILAMACHAIKQKSGEVPVLCQEFQKTESKQSEIPII